MNTKSVILSASGLKNIVMNKYTEEDDFILVFGEQEIQMKKIFIEFISPTVSNLHLSDPTIQKINFNDIITDKKEEFAEFAQDIVAADTITLIHDISTGSSINISKEQSFKLRFLSILLGNEELFKILNETYPPDLDEENLSIYLKYIECCYHFSQFTPDFDFSNIISYISRNFYLIDEEDFLKLSRRFQYAIISNPQLQIRSEDSLLDLILQIINKNDNNSEIDDVNFLEHIEFVSLSENKLRNFLNSFDFNTLTNSIWSKLFECFFIHFNTKSDRISKGHQIKNQTIEFIKNKTNPFNGILTYLGHGKALNAIDEGIVNITSSSVISDKVIYQPRNVLNYEDDRQIFQSYGESNSWLCIDFKNFKINPTHYSLRSNAFGVKGVFNPQSWDIEGSNDLNNWDLLDSRRKEKSLDNRAATNTFEITNKSYNYYQYIRIIQKGVNTRNYNESLCFSSIELFGSIQ